MLVVRASRKEAGVLHRNQEWGGRFLEHQDPYFDPGVGHREHGPYPPSFALVAAPLACLPTLFARVLWASGQIGALVFLLKLLRRRMRELWPELEPHRYAVFGIALVLVSRYLLRDMAGGGGNLLYALLVLWGIELALAGREVRGGLPIALSLVLKPNLAPFVVFLGLRGRWRAVASAIAAAAVLYVLPALYYGPAAYARLSARWASDVIAFVRLDDLQQRALVPDGLPSADYAMNQNLRSAVSRGLRPPGDSGAPDVHVVEVSAHTASWLARGLSLAFLAAAALTAVRASTPRSEFLAALAFFPLALLCSPVTWKAHHVVLLPLFHVLVCCALDRKRPSRALKRFLFAYWLVCNLLSSEIIGDRASDWLQAASVVTLGDVVLLFLVLWLARERRAT